MVDKFKILKQNQQDTWKSYSSYSLTQYDICFQNGHCDLATSQFQNGVDEVSIDRLILQSKNVIFGSYWVNWYFDYKMKFQKNIIQLL